jgi:hypothetical protein
MQHVVAKNAYGLGAQVGDPPTDWREFPQFGNGKIRMTGSRGANSA